MLLTARYVRCGVLGAVVALAVGCSADQGADKGADKRPEDAPVVQLGAPGESSRELTDEEAAEQSAPAHTDADVEFVQLMIPHHQQALEMTSLVEARTASTDLPKLAERIDVAQRDEINQMERWLEERGESTQAHQHGDGSMGLMPGMLTAAQLAALQSATGAEFDRLFLRGMIGHHQGAVAMVERLFSEGKGSQEPQVFQLAQHIDADQRVEISRMQSMLADR